MLKFSFLNFGLTIKTTKLCMYSLGPQELAVKNVSVKDKNKHLLTWIYQLLTCYSHLNFESSWFSWLLSLELAVLEFFNSCAIVIASNSEIIHSDERIILHEILWKVTSAFDESEYFLFIISRFRVSMARSLARTQAEQGRSGRK